jgi:hypothetical protein
MRTSTIALVSAALLRIFNKFGDAQQGMAAWRGMFRLVVAIGTDARHPAGVHALAG